MREYGLIGFPLSHSWSAAYFEKKFAREGIAGTTYTPFPLHSLSELPELIRQRPALKGFNVTIPYKEQIMALLDELTPVARQAGAVNTVAVDRSGDGTPRLTGHNTDVYGFLQGLQVAGAIRPGAALILGTGGASRAVRHALKQQGWECLLVSRTPRDPGVLAYEDLRMTHFRTCKLVVNTTPMGMYPHTGGRPPIPYQWLDKEHILYDLVYNPEVTRFLQAGLKSGCRTIGGIYMLKSQAEEAWRYWNGEADTAPAGGPWQPAG